MVEATLSLPQAPNQAQRQAMACGVRVPAILAAKNAVKRAIQARGLKKLADIPAREITLAAEEYVVGHPELIAEAKETVLRWHAEGVFGPRGDFRTPRPRRATLSNSVQRAMG
jgi:hypothetical protein